MAEPAQVDPRYTVQSYLRLVDTGVLGPDDRVELLEGVIVAMAPQNPRHASATRRVSEALREAIGRRAVVSVQLPLIAGGHSVPEPDIAVLPGTSGDYDRTHPTHALLVVEIADSSLLQDRLTKAAIYASAAVPEYWLLNLRDDAVEVYRAPEPAARRYTETRTARRGDDLSLVAFPGARIRVDDLLPR